MRKTFPNPRNTPFRTYRYARTGIAALAGLIVLASAGLSGCKPEASQTESKGEKVTIAQFNHVFLYMPLYVAARQGFFKEEGLDVKFVSTGGDEKTFTAVAAGNAQFGVADPVFVAVAREKGQGGKVVAGIVRGVPFWVVTRKKEIKPFESPSGFAGYRVGTYQAPSTSYAVMKRILDNDGHPVEAQIVEGGFGTLLPMLRADQADMAMTIEPMVSIAVKDGARIVFSPANMLGDFAFTGLTVSDSFHKEHPVTIQKAVNAISKAMAFIHSDFDGALAVARQEFPEVDPEVVRNALRRLIDQGTLPKNPSLDSGAWDKAVELRKEIGDLEGPATFEDNVDMTFADSALNRIHIDPTVSESTAATESEQ
ncbi:MAG: ABC transporter substrate-binding protein [Candidatus Obscuribacterales bacterium]